MTTPSKAEVWLVNLNPSLGDEMRKLRPAVVVSDDAVGVLALRVVVPVTGWQPRFQGWDWLVRLDHDASNGLDKTAAADTFQVRSVSARRFVRRMGRLTDTDATRVAEGLKVVLGL